MYIRKRGQFYHYEFFVNGNRYAGSFNGKNGAKTAANKKEATEFAYQERRKVLDGTFRDEMEREELKDFVTFVDKVYLPFAREHHSSSTHDEFRCEVMKEYFKTKRFDDITMMLVVKFINERLNSDTDHHDVPVRARLGETADERVVDALVDDAEVAEHGRSGLRAGLRKRFGEAGGDRRGGLARGAEVGDIDARAVEMAVGIQREPLVAHLAAAAEHDVGEGKQRALAVEQAGRRILELRELVHAVVDDGALAEPAGVGRHGHGVVEPEDGLLEAAAQRAGERLEHKTAALKIDEAPLVPARGRQVNAQDGDVGMSLRLANHGLAGGNVEAVRLDEEQWMTARETGEKLLRTLPDPVPAQVAESDDGKTGLDAPRARKLVAARSRLVVDESGSASGRTRKTTD